MIFISLIIKPLVKADDFCEYRRGVSFFYALQIKMSIWL